MRSLISSQFFVRGIKWGTAVVLLGLSSASLANVTLRNGNFFIGYKDIYYPGGFEPSIERIFNSRTPYRGYFGHRWGSEYEVKLVPTSDGGVIIKEFGGGAENFFYPKGYTQANVSKMVEEIAAAAKANGETPNADVVAKYRNRLASDAVFRLDEWEKFIRLKKVKPKLLTAGTTVFSNRFSFQKIVVGNNGYQRVFDTGRVEDFDKEGRLVKVADKNGNFIKFEYGKDGNLKKLEDNKFRKMFFTFNSKGLIEKIDGESGKSAAYQYDSNDNLVYSKDAAGNIYKFSYDKNHFLVRIDYTDKTFLKVDYYDEKNNFNVQRVTDRDGSETEYQYDLDKKDPQNHFKVSVKIRDSKKKLVSTSSYEYFIKNKANGESWTWKLISELDGDKTETVYNEDNSSPVSIKRGGQETKFDYDPKGRVTRKDTANETVVLRYDDRAGKVSYVERLSKVTKTKRWSQFGYDERGNLKNAKNSEGKTVNLFYGRDGLINKMVDQGSREISFKYDENAKPVEITDPKLGTIKVTYSNAGEVKKVDSSAGRQVALQVTNAFQNLLEIIRPAGVTLSF